MVPRGLEHLTPHEHRRLARALSAVNAWLAPHHLGQEGIADDRQEVFTDLLADLEHLAENQGVDFTNATFWAHQHYKAERGAGDDIEQSMRQESAGLVEEILSPDLRRERARTECPECFHARHDGEPCLAGPAEWDCYCDYGALEVPQ